MRMVFLIDTSAVLAVALGEPEREWLIQATDAARLAAPTVLPYEIGNALSAMVKRGRLSVSQGSEAYRLARRIPVEMVEVNVERALRLAMEQEIYAYDAYFLYCAQSVGLPLLTLDRSMQRMAAELGIETLEQE